MNDFETAFARFGEAMSRVQAAFRQTAHKLELLRASSKKLARRMERDYARSTRRPALIHKGGKP